MRPTPATRPRRLIARREARSPTLCAIKQQMSRLFLVLLWLSGCALEDKESDLHVLNNKPTDIVALDTSTYTILPFTDEYSWVLAGAVQSHLTVSEINALEPLIKESFEESRHPNGDLHLATYKRQYIAVKDLLGNRIIWVNFVCAPRADWRQKYTLTLDGGECYWWTKINATTGTILKTHVNGEA